MLAILKDAATAITGNLGEPATYTIAATGATISLRAVTRRDVQFPVSGMEQGVIDRRTVLTFRREDLAGHVPALGDTAFVAADAVTWKILALESDNGYLVTVKVRKP